MNLSAPHCSSSGCESGWTMYLDQSSLTKSQYHGFSRFVDEDYTRNSGDNEEEDLSMVSDASSGPPHYCVEDEDDFDQYATKNRNKKKGKEHGRSQQHLYLDDTASSPELSKKMTKNESSMEHVLEFSQGFSANTHSKGKSGIKKHFGFFQSEKSASKPPGGYKGRKWK